MTKIKIKKLNWNIERKALVVFSILFVTVLGLGWGYALKLRQTVAGNNATNQVKPGALVEVERIRNLAEAQIADTKAYLLLNSKSLSEQQEKEKELLTQALVNFEKQYSLPQVPVIIQRIQALEQKNQELFDQAMDFKEKKTESKIVGQFYQAKTQPIRVQLNESFDELVKIHKDEIDHARTQAREAALGVETQIPKGMLWFTSSLAALFLGVSLLVIRLLRERPAHVAERDRLYKEAIKAVQSRDEAIFAVSQDLGESLDVISASADQLLRASENPKVNENAELIKNTVTVIEGLIKDIRDQKSSEMEGMTLRLDQMGVDEVLESARLLLAPMAKQRDIRVQIDTVNPPVLAFYDRERVLRVLSNLVGNAIKFSPKGSKVVVKVRSDQKFVNISVLDSGTGIPESQLPGIFDNFWQARKTQDQGAGVGLAIVKTIVEAHGGTVQVQSQSGRGSTFTFSLPRRRPVGAPVRSLARAIRTGPNLDGYNDGPLV